MVKLTVIGILLLFAMPVFAITPTDVFIEARATKMGLAGFVTRTMGNRLLPLTDISLEGAKPPHVYSLAAALNAKLGVYMDTKNIKGHVTPPYPAKTVIPKDVLELVKTIQKNMRTFTGNASVMRKPASNKQPSDVMKEILYANLWVDEILANQIKPDHPFLITEKIEINLQAIIKQKRIKIRKRNCPIRQKITPADVFLNAMNFYRRLLLLDRTRFQGSAPLKPYDAFSAEKKITPTDVYTISNYILFYIYHVQQKMAVRPVSTYDDLTLKTGKKPSQVFARFTCLNDYLLQTITTGGLE